MTTTKSIGRYSARNMFACVCVFIGCSAIGSSALAGPASRTVTSEKPRYLVLTDMAHDDPNSMIRLLCYANEIDIEAIIVTPLRGSAAPGPDLLWKKLNVRLDAYGEVVANLKKHDPDFPSLAYLRSISFPHSGSPQIFMGDDQFDDYIGTGLNKDGLPKSTAATDHLKKVFAKKDPRPIHVGLWGGAVPLVQALWEYKQEVSASQFDALVDKLHIWDIALQDVSSDYLADVAEISSRPGRYNGNRAEPAAYVGFHGWGHYLQNDYIDLNRIRNAGGALTAPYGHGGEGDTPSFLYLVSAARGLNDPTDYRQLSWGGNFYPAPHAGPGTFADQNNQEDNVTRWLPIARDDFYGRAEWAVKSPAQTDYRPNVVLNGVGGNAPLRITAARGSTVVLDTAGSSDPEGRSLSYQWFIDPLNHSGALSLSNSNQSSTSLTVPQLRIHPIHVVVEVTDPENQVSYRRAIITPTGSVGSIGATKVEGLIFGRSLPVALSGGNDKYTHRLIKAFDGDTSTYVNSLTKDHPPSVGLDMGTIPGVELELTTIRFVPKFPGDINGARFEGSNESMTSGYETLHTISGASAGWNTIQLATPRAYRYVRLIGAKHNRVTEIEYIVQPE